jgi:hypothetical protein
MMMKRRFGAALDGDVLGGRAPIAVAEARRLRNW